MKMMSTFQTWYRDFILTKRKVAIVFGGGQWSFEVASV